MMPENIDDLTFNNIPLGVGGLVDASVTKTVEDEKITISFPALFFNGFEVSQIFGIPVEDSQPRAKVKSKDVQQVNRADIIFINNNYYKIKSIEPDGQFFSWLKLGESNG